MDQNSIKAYACYNVDEKTRHNSTSGGLFLALCKTISNRKGIVYGVVFDEKYNSIHQSSHSYEDCKKFSGSKYPQSDTELVFCEIKEKLKDKTRPVLFSGTPCQVAALRSFLGKEYDNLFCIDIICMGVASPFLWKEYIDKEFPGHDITDIKFKDKKYGWKKYSIKIQSEKKIIHELGGRNIFMNSYVQGYQMRESCYKCYFKGTNRYSDITIADCWGIEKMIPKWDTFEGVSVAFVNTRKGATLFDYSKEYLISQEVSFDQAIKYNPYYTVSKEHPSSYSLFWKLHKFSKPIFYWYYNANSIHFRALRKIKFLFFSKKSM